MAKKTSTEGTTRIIGRVKIETDEKLQKLADKKVLTKSALINIAVLDLLEKEKELLS